MLENVYQNTDPQVFHAPGFLSRNSKQWKYLIKNLPKIKKENGKIENIDVITWNNLDTSICEESLNQKQIKYFVLGKELKEWNNLVKFSLIKEHCRKSNADIVIGMDSHDVCFFGSIKECVNRFLHMKKKLVFNAELKFYPDCLIPYFQDCKLFQKNQSASKFCFLNSGLWIGYREFCSSFFEECSHIKLWQQFDCRAHPLVQNCDQSVIHGLYKKYPNYVSLDYNCKIFQNLAHVATEVQLAVLY